MVEELDGAGDQCRNHHASWKQNSTSLCWFIAITTGIYRCSNVDASDRKATRLELFAEVDEAHTTTRDTDKVIQRQAIQPEYSHSSELIELLITPLFFLYLMFFASTLAGDSATLCKLKQYHHPEHLVC